MKKLRLDQLNRISVEVFKQAPKFPLVIILDNVRSMNNIGSVFRSSDAFRLEKIYLCGITAQPPQKEIHKTALGATESMEWEYREKTEDVINELKSLSYQVYALEQCDQAISLEHFDTAGVNTAVVLGNEVNGVQQSVIDLCDGGIEIPQYGTKHSLNVSVSAGIVIWDIVQKNQKRVSFE